LQNQKAKSSPFLNSSTRLSEHAYTWLQAFFAGVLIGHSVYQHITKDLNFKSATFCNYLIFNIAPDYPRSDSYACTQGRRPATVGSVQLRATARQTTKRHGALCRAVACEQSEHALECSALERSKALYKKSRPVLRGSSFQNKTTFIKPMKFLMTVLVQGRRL